MTNVTIANAIEVKAEIIVHERRAIMDAVIRRFDPPNSIDPAKVEEEVSKAVLRELSEGRILANPDPFVAIVAKRACYAQTHRGKEVVTADEFLEGIQNVTAIGVRLSRAGAAKVVVQWFLTHGNREEKRLLRAALRQARGNHVNITELARKLNKTPYAIRKALVALREKILEKIKE